MHNLDRRLAALETAHGAGELILVTWLPTDGQREAITDDGKTHAQAAHETRDQFRARLPALLRPTGRKYIWVDEIDAAT